MKSTYKIISDEFAYTLPDTMFKQLGADTTFQIPLGEMYYTNYFKDGKSRTEMSFIPAAGIRITSGSSGYILFNPQDSVISRYTNDSLIQANKTFFPKLVNNKVQKKVEEYDCNLYSFSTDSSHIEFWFTKQLSYSVNPGIWYRNLGGLVRIDYVKGGERQRFQLVSFEETNDKLILQAPRKIVLQKRKIHWLFD